MDPGAVVFDFQVIKTAVYDGFEGVGLVILRVESRPLLPHSDKTFIDNVFRCTVVVNIGIGYLDKHLSASGEYSSEFFFCQVSGNFSFFCHI